MNYNYPSEDELQPNSTYNYDLIPTEQDGNINYTPWVYDQFISLRDTLVYSWKKYNGKAWCKLCVWEKEETVEVIWNNLFQQNFENITDWTRTETIAWPYVNWDYATATNVNTPICCVIQKDGRYKIIHKEEVLLTATTNKVYCYVDIYREDENGTITIWQKKYTMPYIWWVAVFDRECNTTPLSWSTSWTDPNGSCSVPFTFWKLFKKVTAFGYMERNLIKWDILVLRAKDAECWADGSPQWNDLAFQTSSNYWSIEYLNLPIN